MRRLNRKKTLNLVKELDAFPKIPESYIETSTSGGTVSLIAFTTMALLTIMEFTVYRDTWMKYEYEVDKDYTSKLRINVDITVAMKCQHIGADVLDLAETMVATADGLVYEPVIFELSPLQREWQRILQNIQSRLQEEHSLQDIIFKSAFKSASTALPPREDHPVQSADACRIHGHLYVNKVAGNFHVTVGKAIPHPRGHAHLAALVSHESYNFSHRIDHLSFGELIPGIINPLDGTEKIASDHNQMFQYFVTVVPTKLQTHKISAETHQFAVTERERIINHAAGSHGVSGIFMKYDISSLMVTVTEEHMPFWQFLVRLCGIVGGIFSTTGILHSIGRFIVEILCCRFRLKSSKSTPLVIPTAESRESEEEERPGSYQSQRKALMSYKTYKVRKNLAPTIVNKLKATCAGRMSQTLRKHSWKTSEMLKNVDRSPEQIRGRQWGNSRGEGRKQ